ncbi:MAG: hypothetical protein H8D74_00685 [Chloroflexi bacterium]|nr:hypothetical protein [Chloroflexota bacterium]
MSSQTSVASFVLRFVQERTENPPAPANADWYGLIKHVQTDTEERFTRLVDALAFMARYIDLASPDEIISAAESYTAAIDEISHSE